MPEVIGPVRPKVARAFKVVDVADLGGAFLKSVTAAGLVTYQRASDDTERTLQLNLGSGSTITRGFGEPAPDFGSNGDLHFRVTAANVIVSIHYKFEGAWIAMTLPAGGGGGVGTSVDAPTAASADLAVAHGDAYVKAGHTQQGTLATGTWATYNAAYNQHFRGVHDDAHEPSPEFAAATDIYFNSDDRHWKEVFAGQFGSAVWRSFTPNNSAGIRHWLGAHPDDDTALALAGGVNDAYFDTTTNRVRRLTAFAPGADPSTTYDYDRLAKAAEIPTVEPARPEVNRLPTANEDAPPVVYLLHGYSEGEAEAATVTFEFLGDLGIYRHVRAGDPYGSIDKESPITAIEVEGDATGYSPRFILADDLAWLNEFDEARIGSTAYTLSEAVSLGGGVYRVEILNPPAGLAGTMSLNLIRESDDSDYFTDESDALYERGEYHLYRRADDEYRWARLEPLPIIHNEGVSAPASNMPPQRDYELFFTRNARMFLTNNNPTEIDFDYDSPGIFMHAGYVPDPSDRPTIFNDGIGDGSFTYVPSVNEFWQYRGPTDATVNNVEGLTWNEVWGYLYDNIAGYDTAEVAALRDSVFHGRFANPDLAAQAVDEYLHFHSEAFAENEHYYADAQEDRDGFSRLRIVTGFTGSSSIADRSWVEVARQRDLLPYRRIDDPAAEVLQAGQALGWGTYTGATRPSTTALRISRRLEEGDDLKLFEISGRQDTAANSVQRSPVMEIRARHVRRLYDARVPLPQATLSASPGQGIKTVTRATPAYDSAAGNALIMYYCGTFLGALAGALGAGDTSITVSDGSLVAVGDVLVIGSEDDIEVTAIAENVLTVTRPNGVAHSANTSIHIDDGRGFWFQTTQATHEDYADMDVELVG